VFIYELRTPIVTSRNSLGVTAVVELLARAPSQGADKVIPIVKDNDLYHNLSNVVY
jgi:hypothetical protein